MKIEDIPTEWREKALQAILRKAKGSYTFEDFADAALLAVIPEIYRTLSMPDRYWLLEDPETLSPDLDSFLENGIAHDGDIYHMGCARSLPNIYVLYPDGSEKGDTEPQVFKTYRQAVDALLKIRMTKNT